MSLDPFFSNSPSLVPLPRGTVPNLMAVMRREKRDTVAERSNVRMSVPRQAILVLLGLLLAWPGTIHAETAEFVWGSQSSISFEYNDNVELDNQNPIDDFITTLWQGFSLGIRTEEIEPTVNFRIGAAFYQERTDLNSIRMNLDLSGFKGIHLAENLVLDLDQSLQISEDPIELDESVTSVHRTRDRYLRNRFRGRLNYQCGEEDQTYFLYENVNLATQDSVLSKLMRPPT